VLVVVDGDESELLCEADAGVGGLIVLVDEELLRFTVAGVFRLLLWLSRGSTDSWEVRISGCLFCLGNEIF